MTNDKALTTLNLNTLLTIEPRMKTIPKVFKNYKIALNISICFQFVFNLFYNLT